MSINGIGPNSGVLYFLQGPHHKEEKVIRVGKTTTVNFYRRLSSYNSAYPRRDATIVALRIFNTRSEAENEEKRLLNSFTRVNSKGDWVHYDQNVKEYIRRDCKTDTKFIENFKCLAHKARKEQDKMNRNK